MPSSDSGDDFVWVGGPGEGFGIIVGLDEEAVDGGLEVDDTSKDTALESPFGEFVASPNDRPSVAARRSMASNCSSVRLNRS